MRVRTEWTTVQAVRDGCSVAEARHRLQVSRQRVNELVAEFARALNLVDYLDAPTADLSWLRDPDDLPIMQTALAAGADTLVTDNSQDFPLGEERNGILNRGRSGILRLFLQSPLAN